MKLRKEFIIGVIASFTLVAFYWGFSYLKGNNLFAEETEFVLVYDKVAGLNVSNPVTLNGLKIGNVSSIGFIPGDEKARILVKIKITNPDIKIPDKSIAVIKSDLLGVNTIEIQFRPSDRFAVSGDTLNSNVATTIQEEVSMQMMPIKAKAEEMMGSLDSVLAAIKYIFNSETQVRLSETFRSIQITISNLERSSSSLDTIIHGQQGRISHIFLNVESITENLASNNEKINTLISNFSQLSDSIAQMEVKKTFDNLDKAVGDFQIVMDKINRGEGTLGQLVNNDTLYNELEKSSKELNLLLEDLRLNPSRYVRVSVFGGKNNQPYSAPEATPKTKK